MAAPANWGVLLSVIGSDLSSPGNAQQAALVSTVPFANALGQAGRVGSSYLPGASPMTVGFNPGFQGPQSPAPITAKVNADGNSSSGSGLNTATAAASNTEYEAVPFANYVMSFTQAGTVVNNLVDSAYPGVSKGISVAASIIQSQSVTGDNFVGVESLPVKTASSFGGSRLYLLGNYSSTGTPAYVQENLKIQYMPPAPAAAGATNVSDTGTHTVFNSPGMSVSMMGGAIPYVQISSGTIVLSEGASNGNLNLVVDTPVTLPPAPPPTVKWQVSYAGEIDTSIQGVNSTSVNQESMTLSYGAAFVNNLPAAVVKA